MGYSYFVLMLRPISLELVLFLDFWVSNIPRYVCFCFVQMDVFETHYFELIKATRKNPLILHFDRIINFKVPRVKISFLARLHFSAEELLLYPQRRRQRPCRRRRQRPRRRPQNVRANVKVLEFESLCIFSCILTLLIILIKPLTAKAYDRRASGDCGASGYPYA